MQPESFAERVEQREREHLHVRRVRFLGVAALGEVAHRPRARVARVGDRRNDARRLEQQSFANPVAGHDELARLEASQHLSGDRDAGDDDVGALRIQSRHLASLVRRHVGQHVEDVLEVRARDVRRVHRPRRRENSLPREKDSGEVGERSAGADELGAAPIASWNVGANGAADGFPELAHAARRDAVLEELLGQPDRAEGQRARDAR